MRLVQAPHQQPAAPVQEDHGAAEQMGVLAASPERNEDSNSKEIQVTLQGFSCLMMFQNMLTSIKKNQSSEYLN